MTFKQLYFPNAKPDTGKNGNSKPTNKQDLIAAYNKISEKHYILRMQEMAEANIHLENLVDEQTKEIDEIVATNNKFISIIAHDLRSPFSSILGALEILKESLSDYHIDDIEKYIDIASKSANSTLSLLESLLVWTISQNKEQSFNPVKINLHELLAIEIENSNTSAMQKQITLNNFVTPDLNVSADIQMVKTVFRNLLSNAVKYTNNGGEITVNALESKLFVEIAIKDDGVGISSEAQKGLFKIASFHSTVGTNNERGAGFGLLLCKEFVEMHGGNIHIESEPDKGCEFKFTLPHYI